MNTEDAINYTVSMYQEHCQRKCQCLPGYWNDCLKCETMEAMATIRRAMKGARNGRNEEA